MISSRSRKFFIVFSLFMALLMAFLGAWQLQRLAWKEALIAELDAAEKAAPKDMLPSAADLGEDGGFWRYRLTGSFDNDKEVHLAIRYYKNKLGYHVLVPFTLSDGRVIMLNRGWVPTEKKEQAKRPESVAQGEQTVTVMLRSDKDYNYFTPANQPEKNVWFWREIPAIAKFTGHALYPLSADIIGEQKDDILPVPSNGHIELRNDHLGYAMTWFGIGVAIVVMTIIYIRKNRTV
jgi:surfeit locus 1 family protein